MGPASGHADVAAGRWSAHRVFEMIVVVTVLGVLAVGLVTLAAAIAGVARPLVVAPAGLVLWLGLLAAWRPDRASRSAVGQRRAPFLVILAGCLVIAGSAFANAAYHGDYVRTDRDPGIYTAGGLWIANQGDLVVDGRGPGLDDAPGLGTTALGQQTLKGVDTDLEIQGTHLFPSYLAIGSWVGGDVGFKAAPAVLGALGLAAFFLLALWFLRPWLAVAAVTALGVNFVFVYTVRSSLSEPTNLLFAMFGLWAVLVAMRDRSWPRMALAGALSAATLCARVDGGVALLALPAAIAIATRWRAADGDRRSPWLLTLAFVIGMVPPSALAWIDLHHRSAFYLHFHQEQVGQVEFGLIAGVILAILVLVIGDALARGRGSGVTAWVLAHRRRIAGGLVVAVVGMAVLAAFVRPLLEPVRGGLPDGGGRGTMEAIQVGEGLPADGSRTYAEVSLDRLGWYLGPVTLALAVAGLAATAFRGIAGNQRGDKVLLLALVVPTTVLYVWKPSIFPDQPWMMRRYLPIVLPGLIILALHTVDIVTTVLASRVAPSIRRPVVAAALIIGAVLMVGAPLRVTVPLRTARWQAGGMQGLDKLCDAVGPNGAAVFSYESQIGITLLPSFRGRCGVPAARSTHAQSRGIEPFPVAEVQASVQRAGRELYLVANAPETIRAMAPNALEPQPIVVLDTTAVKATLNLPPSQFVPQRMVVWVAKVPAS